MSNTTQITVTKAVQILGTSRPSFYKNYIKTGLISSNRTEKGYRLIDVSEFLRVFPDYVYINGSVVKKESPELHALQHEKLVVLQEKIEGLKEQLALKDQLLAAKDKQIALLEYHQAAKKRRWFGFGKV